MGSLKRWKVMPALPYRIGFSRLSCATCIFGDARQFATIRWLDPARFERLVQYEQQFGCTIKRTLSLEQLAEQGRPYDAALAAPDLTRACLSSRPIPTVLTPAWEFPAGAFGQGAGPT